MRPALTRHWPLALLLVIASTLLWAPVPATATTDPDGPRGILLPSTASLGDQVVVSARNWPAHVQIQATVCGDLGIGGSSACDLSGSVLGTSDRDGTVRLELTVSPPPRPCPCIVRLTSFTAASTALDLGLVIRGHRVGTPPVEQAPVTALTLASVRVTDPSLGVRLGIGGTARLVLEMANSGTTKQPVPAFRYRLGGLAGHRHTPSVTVPAGQQREISLPVSVPAGWGGARAVEVRWADGTAAASATWTTRPWLGWALAGLAVTLGVMAMWRRRRGGRRPTAPAAASLPRYPLPDVVVVADLGGVLVNPELLIRSNLLDRVAGRISAAELADLALADRALADRALAQEPPVEVEPAPAADREELASRGGP